MITAKLQFNMVAAVVSDCFDQAHLESKSLVDAFNKGCQSTLIPIRIAPNH